MERLAIQVKSQSKLGRSIALFTALAAAASVYASTPSGTSFLVAAVILRWFALVLFTIWSLSRSSQAVWIFLGLLAGAAFGHDWPSFSVHLLFLGTIFLRLIKTVVAPLLFGTLVVGIAGHPDPKKLGRLGIKALIYFEIVSTSALLIGFAASKFSRAGEGFNLFGASHGQLPTVAETSIAQLLVGIFPENIAKSVADAQILQIVVFSILFAMALTMVPETKRQPMLAFAESLSETMFKFTNLVMLAAPVGVFGSVAYTVGKVGFQAFLPVVRLLATLYVALGIFVVLILLPIALFFRIRIRPFLEASASPLTIAFATASSEAALPRAIEHMESIGVPRDIAAFVLPTGFAFNAAGSNLYQSVALIFLVQAAGLQLTMTQQMVMLGTLFISSKGTAGVARASLLVVLSTASSFHLPAEAGFLLIGLDQVMDMGRTAINVLGNCLACVTISKWEGEMLKDPPSGEDRL